jgi:hypothetical protein
MRLRMKTLTAAAAVLGITLVLAGSPAGISLAKDDGPRSPLVSSAVPVPSSAWYASTAVDDSESANTQLNNAVRFYCATCHGGVAPVRELNLEGFDVSAAADNPVVAEMIVKKLRAEMMPPRPFPRPEGDTLRILAETLERNLDRAASRNVNPGVRPFQRLNRPEYEAAVHNLLGLHVDAGEWLPLDAMDANFDNIAEAQLMSPLLVESFLNAAAEITRMALGDRNAKPTTRTYVNLDYVSQHPWDHVPGAPYGTRGGMVVNHVFPADGYYVIQVGFSWPGNTRLEDIDISLDGERVALLHYENGVGVNRTDQTGRAAAFDGGLATEPVFVRAGQRRVSVAFIRKAEGPYESLMRPHEWALAGTNQGTGATTLWPHIGAVFVAGPTNVAGVSDTPSRQKIFSCRPTTAAEELPCAREIITRMGSEAFRRPVTEDDVTGIMNFYDMGAREGGFENGVRTALEAILSHPNFYFRMEREPSNARAGRNVDVSDLDLASRLSFFLWGLPPDEELLAIAARNRLSGRTLEEQALRMLADPRAEGLATRFAAQWLRLQDIAKVRPDPNFFTTFDENLAQAMRRETELFFYNMVREDRSVLDIFTADYTFVNERLARHYGFENVAGSHFRKVQYPDDSRVGIFGHGSVLVLTSLAGRTSPVMRGKWIMEVILGTPPPLPPPDVPLLFEV